MRLLIIKMSDVAMDTILEEQSGGNDVDVTSEPEGDASPSTVLVST